MLKRTDMTNMNDKQLQRKLWRYVWTTKEFRKSISSELNAKRNSFVFLVKTCFECVLIAKQGRDYLKKVIMTTCEWIAKPSFFTNEFIFFKHTLFVLMSTIMNPEIKLHHNNIKLAVEKYSRCR